MPTFNSAFVMFICQNACRQQKNHTLPTCRSYTEVSSLSRHPLTTLTRCQISLNTTYLNAVDYSSTVHCPMQNIPARICSQLQIRPQPLTMAKSSNNGRTSKQPAMQSVQCTAYRNNYPTTLGGQLQVFVACQL